MLTLVWQGNYTKLLRLTSSHLYLAEYSRCTFPPELSRDYIFSIMLRDVKNQEYTKFVHDTTIQIE